MTWFLFPSAVFLCHQKHQKYFLTQGKAKSAATNLNPSFPDRAIALPTSAFKTPWLLFLKKMHLLLLNRRFLPTNQHLPHPLNPPSPFPVPPTASQCTPHQYIAPFPAAFYDAFFRHKSFAHILLLQLMISRSHWDGQLYLAWYPYLCISGRISSILKNIANSRKMSYWTRKAPPQYVAIADQLIAAWFLSKGVIFLPNSALLHKPCYPPSLSRRQSNHPKY